MLSKDDARTVRARELITVVFSLETLALVSA
jgi:hypothetical protein